jgi:acyl-CoA synthetase (NDP forming)
MASVGNPVDMIASAGPTEYTRTIATLLAAPEVDSLLVIFTPVDPTTADAVLQAIRNGVTTARHAGATSKPVVACVMAKPGRPVPLETSDERIPAFAFPENAVRALGRASAYAEWRAKPAGLLWGFDDIDARSVRATCHGALARSDDGWLNHDEVRDTLNAYGLPLAAGVLAQSPDHAATIAAQMGFPVAAKLSSQTIQHKTDIGAVHLNLQNAADVRRAFTEILDAAKHVAPRATLDSVLIQPMITDGVEIMMGIAQDPVFGPLVAFGLGGVHVEILKDVRIRIAPLTDRDVDELIHSIKGFPLLQGYRGHPPADIDALRNVLLRLSRLADDIPEIAELDLNPVMALAPGLGCRIVDARIRVKAVERPGQHPD